MSKGKSYLYTGTMGHLVATINSLPSDPNMLLKMGWVETTHPIKASLGMREFKEISTGLEIRFDKGKTGGSKFTAVDHYHIYNPKTTGNNDLYLDKTGKTVRKGARQSHIFPI